MPIYYISVQSDQNILADSYVSYKFLTLRLKFQPTRISSYYK